MENHKTTPRSITSALLLAASFTAASASAQVLSLEEAEAHFALKVQPLLKQKCFACHGDDKDELEGGLDMTSLDEMLFGGDAYENALVPGSPDESAIFQAILWKDEDLEMPPKENDRLTEDQVEIVRQWIENGALWPSAERIAHFREANRLERVNEEGMIIDTSGGTSEEWTYRRYQPEDMWAFDPVVKPEIPADFEGNPIDYFVHGKLAEAGHVPAPPTDARTLVRRATYDLIGLPPTPEEVNEFERAHRRDPDAAMAELIDRLLASPHHGERWAQHWLDISRYADTAGLSNDYERSNLWRYRDYVIRAFNEDKPYNEFIVEQLAGDEMYELQPEGEKDPELLVATGFLRMGPWDPAMVLVPQARQQYLDDVVDAVGQTFLSTTMSCLKCHDHKFDPLPTRDYYRMYATFAGTQMAERPAEFLPEENLNGMEEGKAMVEMLLAYADERKDALRDKQENAARAWFEEHGLEYVGPDERKDLPDDVKPPRNVGLNYIEEGRYKVRKQDSWIWTRRLERYEPMVQSVYNGPTPKFLNARKLRMPEKIDMDWRPENYIYTGGALEALGDPVQPGVLSALGLPVNADAPDPYVIHDDLFGRRYAFAQWVADPRNQLATRSIVNRVWQYHFGEAIAGNPNNFGAKGEKPTHPELLDWLTADFVENGWKFKRLHRLIMSSQAYQMSSQHPDRENLANSDPDNKLLAYYPNRRLTAEELRDSMLFMTGELNTEVGGLPIMPEINMEVALQPRMIQFSLAPAYQPSRTPEQRNRRSIYAYRVRGQADPFLEIFNQPNPNISCERRDVAAVSPQAFTMMNSDVVTDRSIAFANRLNEEVWLTSAKINRAFEIALNRKPTAEEKKRLMRYLKDMTSYHSEVEPDPVVYPTEITRSLVEEFSGSVFEYQEILPVFDNYVADFKATDVDAKTRALADICLLLFNTNEFTYLY
ncbi:MAG: PSD1 and planctomycete cytochrome C domain-containing protein [Synoicihabitans sp.]